MAIRIRHDAAALVPPSNNTTRKYGQNLVLQQQQQKYQAQQAGLDRWYNTLNQYNQNQFQMGRDLQRTSDQAARDKMLFDQQQQMAEADRQRSFMDEARKQSSGFIMEDIKNGAFDPNTARKLQQNLVEEAEVLGNPQYDATQRAEALQKLRAARTLLLANRMEPPKQPTPQEQFDQSVVVDPQTGMRFRRTDKGDYEPLPQPEQPEQPAPQPTSFAEFAQADPDKARSALAAEIDAIQQSVDDGMTTLPEGKTVEDLAFERLERPFQAMRNRFGPSAASQAGAQAGSAIQSALEQPPASQSVPTDGTLPPAPSQAGIPVAVPDPGRPPAPRATPSNQPTVEQIPVATPDPGRPPSPSAQQPRDQMPITANSQSQNPAGVPQAFNRREIRVDGKPLAVTPGTLTPQETAARAQIMELPREERIRALMPYDPELKGRTLEQILDAPESKSQYEQLKSEGLATGNYREDMLSQLDEMLQHNVLNAAGQAPPPAYVGMRADDIKDPKAKAEVAKLPRPKTKNDRAAIRSGQLYVDPEGVIRARS